MGRLEGHCTNAVQGGLELVWGCLWQACDGLCLRRRSLGRLRSLSKAVFYGIDTIQHKKSDQAGENRKPKSDNTNALRIQSEPLSCDIYRELSYNNV